ncbi:ABC transporter permease [Paraclostridium bifermentans]|uniref:ABC transporter permease n=1 Tax=Paraclostridium bifermentans TaxID=1490 RepID=UPI00359C9587
MIKKLKDNKTNIFKILILLGVLWILIGYILFPAFRTLILSIKSDNGFTLNSYKEFFSIQANVVALKNTILLGVASVIACGIVGTFLAFIVTYFKFPLKNIISKLLLTPIMVPGIIIVLAFIQLYGESGIITKSIESVFNLSEIPFRFTGFWGILFVHAYTQYVYFFMNISVAIKHIDYSSIEAAKNLGASKFYIFKTIIIPFIKPALIASSLITFITSIGSFSAPSLIGDRYKVITTQMLFAKSNNRMDIASVQVVILTFIAITFLLICRYYEKKSSIQEVVKGTPIKEVEIQNKLLKNMFTIISFIIIIFILLPVITIFILSFVTPGSWLIEIFPKEFSIDNYISIFTKSRTFKPFLNSINMSIIAAIIGVLVSIICSYIIVKTKSRLKLIIEILAMLPLAIPASAIAVNLINAFNQPNIFSFNQSLVGKYMILPIAYFIGVLPFIFRSTNLSMYNLNPTYEEASKSLGASFWHTLKSVTIPIIKPGIIAGVLLGFVKSVGEYTSSAYLYNINNKPVSIAMVNGVFEYQIGLAMAYGVLVILITTILSFFIQKIGKIN